ncbi:Biopolymer transport protein ExbD/TolR [Caenispirillum salinarum AK4]|uniref:Biopolymer transport protein ExbD/TolR n=1 Tax=Caenispirillum salinarum AK4 TaxID=1238182 RepID=K9HLX9_9PROT|nr:protein TolR [Caenispirillum salinarum]EKV31358.1 Biopolymer transport protein ExbD/TolR [Caenispirillum salinarum AK4]
MAMFVNNKSSTGYRRGRRAMSDINVTPMVDVMLVLLVIFMVTAPMLATGVEVDLPEAASPALPQEDPTSITIQVLADGQVAINDAGEEMSRTSTKEALLAQMAAVRQSNPEGAIFVRGDGAANYGRVMEVMGILYDAGYREVNLVTQRPSGAQ